MKRRRFLLGGAAAVMAAGAIHRLQARTLKSLPSIPIDLAHLPSRDELWRWIEGLNSFGPRLTGSEAHARSINYLATEFEALGLQVQRDAQRIQRWTARRSSLTLSDGSPVAVAAEYPYSGMTSARGVKGELHWFDKKPGDFSAARGKIAIVPVERVDLSPLKTIALFKCKSRLPDTGADFQSGETTPLLGPLLAAFLPQARQAGVLGVICVFEGLSDAQAQQQVLPFTTAYAGCPALWVTAHTGQRLKEAAQQGLSATLILDAVLEDTQTDTLYAVLPGNNARETIIINTHTDGPNACEENGAAGLLALARHQSRRAERNRTQVFVMATGHFQIPQVTTEGQATSAWLAHHPELWDGKNGHAKAVAGLTLEHLGCTEWKDDMNAGGPAPTGRLERELVYTTNPVMEQIYLEAVADRSKLRSLTLSPRIGKVFFGEAQPLFAAGIPSISLIPVPDYLCQVLPDGGIERLDPDFAHQQVTSFTRALHQLDALATADIGAVTPTWSEPRALLKSWAAGVFGK
ncbi:MAG TPA: hypothetical protein VJA19_12225 [Pseudomonas sp.]|nr:hypothetical protein [Pseudomonas sp.]